MLGMTASEEIMANGHSDYDLDIDGVVAELGRLRSSLGSNEEEFGFLANLLQSAQLQSLVQAHSTIMSTLTENQCQPVLSTAEDIAFEVMGEIQLKGLTAPDAVELFRLLQTPHMLNILSAHDMVAQKDYVPRLPELPTDAEDEEEETVKIVQLVKSNEPLLARPPSPPPSPPPPQPSAPPLSPPLPPRAPRSLKRLQPPSNATLPPPHPPRPALPMKPALKARPPRSRLPTLLETLEPPSEVRPRPSKPPPSLPRRPRAAFAAWLRSWLTEIRESWSRYIPGRRQAGSKPNTSLKSSQKSRSSRSLDWLAAFRGEPDPAPVTGALSAFEYLY